MLVSQLVRLQSVKLTNIHLILDLPQHHLELFSSEGVLRFEEEDGLLGHSVGYHFLLLITLFETGLLETGC